VEGGKKKRLEEEAAPKPATKSNFQHRPVPEDEKNQDFATKRGIKMGRRSQKPFTSYPLKLPEKGKGS